MIPITCAMIHEDADIQEYMAPVGSSVAVEIASILTVLPANSPVLRVPLRINVVWRDVLRIIMASDHPRGRRTGPARAGHALLPTIQQFVVEADAGPYDDDPPEDDGDF